MLWRRRTGGEFPQLNMEVDRRANANENRVGLAVDACLALSS